MSEQKKFKVFPRKQQREKKVQKADKVVLEIAALEKRLREEAPAPGVRFHIRHCRLRPGAHII